MNVQYNEEYSSMQIYGLANLLTRQVKMAIALLLRGNSSDKEMAKFEMQMTIESMLMWKSTLENNRQLLPFVNGLASEIATGIDLIGDFEIHSGRDEIHTIHGLLLDAIKQCGLTSR